MNYNSSFSALIPWYFFHKRDFPWRNNINLDKNSWIYQTWVCEIMSQQTLISVVLPKFNKFIEQLPNIHSLANCSEEKLRELWAGLGYYARARNLKLGAAFIIEKLNAQFPTNKQDWLKVPGCGDYTAAIIASICFYEKTPAIDGNMIRVASRLMNLQDGVWEKSGKNKIAQFMQEMMSELAQTYLPGDINQAIMDLGSMVCKKLNPICDECPLKISCLAYKNKTTHICPPTKPRTKSISEEIYALILRDISKESYLILERQSGFLSNTIGFPILARKNGYSLEAILNKIKNDIKTQIFEKNFTHQITHHKITGFVTLLETNWTNQKVSDFLSNFSFSKKFTWVYHSELKKQLSSSLDQKVLKILS
jgi:A/G-specific adenine glycosylase